MRYCNAYVSYLATHIAIMVYVSSSTRCDGRTPQCKVGFVLKCIQRYHDLLSQKKMTTTTADMATSLLVQSSVSSAYCAILLTAAGGGCSQRIPRHFKTSFKAKFSGHAIVSARSARIPTSALQVITHQPLHTQWTYKNQKAPRRRPMMKEPDSLFPRLPSVYGTVPYLGILYTLLWPYQALPTVPYSPLVRPLCRGWTTCTRIPFTLSETSPVNESRFFFSRHL